MIRLNAKGNFLFFLTGVMIMLNGYGCAGESQYTSYSGKDPALNLSVDCISGWVSQEHKDAERGLVSLLFFRDEKGTGYKPKMSLILKQGTLLEILPADADSMANDLIQKRSKFKNAKLLSNTRTKVLGLEARQILISYQAMDNIYAFNAKPLPVKERIVVFKKGDAFCLLRYENKEQDFDKFESAFSRMVKSLKFK
jgi:hypothetical protein